MGQAPKMWDPTYIVQCTKNLFWFVKDIMNLFSVQAVQLLISKVTAMRKMWSAPLKKWTGVGHLYSHKLKTESEWKTLLSAVNICNIFPLLCVMILI